MKNLTAGRLLRAAVLAGLAALVLSTHVFTAVDRVRVKVLQAPTAATAGSVRATTAGFPEAKDLRPPIALIARITSASPGSSPFSIAVDGAPVCERGVAGGASRRVDCAVVGAWNQTPVHEITVQGPSTGWTLEYLELATHHGNTDGTHYVVVLPASSDRYVRPAASWAIATWLVLMAAMLLLPPSPPLPRWILVPYGIAAGAVVLELALIQGSQWMSDYRIVLSAGTFWLWLVLLFVPRLWVAGRASAQPGATYLNARPTARRWAVGFVGLLLIGAASWQLFLQGRRDRARIQQEQARGQEEQAQRSEQARVRLFEELRPINLANCEFKRFGEPNDGGYILCANLLAAAQSGYSYGISGYDQWGCDISRGLRIPVHQYDCFNLTVPACPGGRTVFHGECIGTERATIDNRPFDTLENQLVKNGDGVKRVVMKMDVEGAEWDSLQQAPDEVLQRIDQLTIELHGVGEAERFTAVVLKLKEFFYVANVHFNNFACQEGIAPFPAEVYEVLFVSKRLGVPGGPGPAGAPAVLMTPNTTQWKDCQTLADLPPVRSPAQ